MKCIILEYNKLQGSDFVFGKPKNQLINSMINIEFVVFLFHFFFSEILSKINKMNKIKVQAEKAVK